MPNALPLKVQNEIMSEVITKLLDTVSIQSTELLQLKEENKDLRIKLTALYKTIILLKSFHSPFKFNHFPSTKLNQKTTPSPYSSPHITKNKGTVKKPCLLTINKGYMSKGKISRNTNSFETRKTDERYINDQSNSTSQNHANVSSNDTQSMLINTQDKINTSKYLSNTSSNGFITLSPRPIGDYYQYKRIKKIAQNSIDRNHLSTSKIKDKRSKIIKGYKEIQKIDEKNLIRVSIVKKKK